MSPFRRHIKRYYSAFTSTTIFKTLNLGNQCIKITRTRSDKTAWFVTIQIYGSAQTLIFVTALWLM